jgi:hypothetical protein
MYIIRLRVAKQLIVLTYIVIYVIKKCLAKEYIFKPLPVYHITFVHIRHIIAVEYYLSVLKEARIGRRVAETEADLTEGV